MDDGESLTALVAREIVIEGIGRADLLLVDGDGVPIVVEVKLLRNPESRREVVGQIFDYVSALSEMTADELDKCVNGALDVALHDLCRGDDDDRRFDDLWGRCAANLRAGNIRVVIVVDSAPDDLVRIVSYVCSKQVDVRLVSVSRFETLDKQPLLVSDLIACPKPGAAAHASASGAGAGTECTDLWRYLADQTRRLIPLRSSAPAPRHFHQIQTGIPGIHYEWSFHGRPRSSFAVELHFERGDKASNRAAFDKLALLQPVPTLSEATNEAIQVQADWGIRYSRLYAEYANGDVTDDLKAWAVKTMVAFYQVLQPKLEEIGG